MSTVRRTQTFWRSFAVTGKTRPPTEPGSSASGLEWSSGTGEVPRSLEDLQETLRAVWSRFGVLALAGMFAMGVGWVWGFITGMSLITEATRNEEEI